MAGAGMQRARDGEAAVDGALLRGDGGSAGSCTDLE